MRRVTLVLAALACATWFALPVHADDRPAERRRERVVLILGARVERAKDPAGSCLSVAPPGMPRWFPAEMYYAKPREGSGRVGMRLRWRFKGPRF